MDKKTVPEKWCTERIGNLIEFEYGKGLAKKSRNKNGKYSVFGSNGIIGKHSDYLIKDPCIIVGRKGAVGEIHLSNNPCWPIDTTYYVRASEIFDLTFLYYQLKTLRLSDLDKSTAIPGLNRNDAYKKFLFIPPIYEQHRIVAKIEELFSELDKGVEALKTAQQQLKTHRQAVLKWAFEGKLTEGWRKYNINLPIEMHLRGLIESAIKKKAKRTHLLKDIPDKPFLPKIPDEWIWVKLNEVAEDIFDGPFGSNLKTNDYVDKGIRVVRLENIGRAEFKNEFETFISEEKYELLKKHTVGHEDIVFSSFINEEIRATILPDHLIKAINKADCFCVRVNKSVMNHFYLMYFLISRTNYNQLKMQIHGATRPRINTSQLKNCLVPYCSYEEQMQTIREIEIRFSAMDKIESAINNALQQAEALRQSILKKAFEGKLVPQDPNDEPASVLLDLIKAEQSARDSEIKNKKKASYGR